MEVYVLDQEDGDLTFAGELEEAYDYYDDDRRNLDGVDVDIEDGNVMEIEASGDDKHIVIMAVGLADGSSFDVKIWSEENDRDGDGDGRGGKKKVVMAILLVMFLCGCGCLCLGVTGCICYCMKKKKGRGPNFAGQRDHFDSPEGPVKHPDLPKDNQQHYPVAQPQNVGAQDQYAPVLGQQMV